VRVGLAFTAMLACGILAGDVVLAAEPGQPKTASAAASKGKKPRVRRQRGSLASVPIRCWRRHREQGRVGAADRRCRNGRNTL